MSSLVAVGGGNPHELGLQRGHENITLPSIPSHQGRGISRSPLPWRERARVRGYFRDNDGKEKWGNS